MAQLQLNSAPKLSARFFSGFATILLAYFAIGVFTHLLEDGVQYFGFLPGEKTDPTISSIVIVALTTFVWTLVTSSFLMTLLARNGFQTTSALSFFRTVELLIIETIRAIGATLIRLPLLILPGLFEWIRLAPISFLVLLDRDYQEGRVDILKASRAYFARHPVRVLLLLLPTAVLFVLELVIQEASTDTLSLWEAPLQHAGSIFVFSLLKLAGDAFVFSRYRHTFLNVDRTPGRNVE